ncbi:hypothetical protein niasHS_006476 [Heterodera schachtii]|uniref:Succinate dehydrogenase assembly factor 2, mitochondrial n=1 Tax=Heterodera schachtii TaxID=97005 RepID=A0ABD2JHM3_HETSC
MHSLLCPRASSSQLSALFKRFSVGNGTASTDCATKKGPVDVLRARLLYQSRKRGIRENDILIGGFAEEHLAKMEEHELEQYDRVINGRHTEWELFHYFSGVKEAPDDLDKNAVFQRMRQHFGEKKPRQLPAVQEEKDERTLRIERMADQILDQRQLRAERRAQGIMYDEEIIEGRVVRFNYAGEFCEQRGIGEIHRQLRHFMIGCALVGAVTFAFVKIDLKKKRRRKMWERQNQLYEARKEAMKKQKQQQLMMAT